MFRVFSTRNFLRYKKELVTLTYETTHTFFFIIIYKENTKCSLHVKRLFTRRLSDYT